MTTSAPRFHREKMPGGVASSGLIPPPSESQVRSRGGDASGAPRNPTLFPFDPDVRLLPPPLARPSLPRTDSESAPCARGDVTPGLSSAPFGLD